MPDDINFSAHDTGVGVKVGGGCPKRKSLLSQPEHV